MNENELLLSRRFMELGNMSYQRGIPFFSDFLTLNEQDILNQVMSKMPPICVKTIGGYHLAERKIAAFYPDEAFFGVQPIVCLSIVPLNQKFAEELTHRDYLGSLMNLGIERSVLGDIVMGEQGAYLFCHEKISEFVIQELVRIRHTPVMASICEFDEAVAVKKEEITGFVASLRLDAILSLVTKLSRSKVIGYIEEAKVFVNGKLITTNSYNLKENDIISVRGIGKFQYKSVSGTSKKGRQFVTIDKYC